MAAYERLKSGKHSFIVRLPNGKRKRFTDQIKRVAKEQADEFERSLRMGTGPRIPDRRLTVRAWHDRWIKARNVEKTTAHEEGLRLAKYVLPQWGSWPLQAIGRIDIQAWVTELGRERGPHVAVGCYRVLQRMLADAELEGVLAASPCRKITLPKIDRPAPRWLTREEFDRLLLAFDDDGEGRPVPQGAQWQAMVSVACHSGLRSGELAGLDVGQIDFDRGLIRVGQVMTKFGLRAYPKSASSRRSVPVHPDALALLWPIVADKAANAAAFPAPRGGRLDQSNFLKTVWHPALRRAGIEPVRAYVTRHTFASWLVQAGVPLWDIAQALGHRTTEFVSRYAFLAPDAHEGIRAAWSEARDSPVTHGPSGLWPASGITAGEKPEIRA